MLPGLVSPGMAMGLGLGGRSKPTAHPLEEKPKKKKGKTPEKDAKKKKKGKTKAKASKGKKKTKPKRKAVRNDDSDSDYA